MARSARGTVALYRALADRRRLATLSVDGPVPDASAGTDLLRLEAWTERAVVRAGSEVRVRFRVTVAAGWHVNPAEVRDPDLVPTVLAGPAEGPATLARTTAPSPVERVLIEGMDPVPVLEGGFAVRAVIVIAADAPAGPLGVLLTLTFQPCSGTECQAPRTLDVTLPLVVAAEEGPPRHESLFR